MTGRYAPGYGDCPLELNDALCLAADTVRGCGLAVTPQHLLDPPQEYHRHFRHCRPSRDRHPRRLCDLPFKGDLLVPQARHDLFHTRLIGEKRMQIREVFDRKRFVFLDGGMGTQLQARGLQPEQKPELAALEMPEVLRPSTLTTPTRARIFCWQIPLVPTPRTDRLRPHGGGGRFRFHRLCAQGRRDHRRVCSVGHRPSGRAARPRGHAGV